jgi:hypothetical protein
MKLFTLMGTGIFGLGSLQQIAATRLRNTIIMKGTMPAPVSATITTLQMVGFGQYHETLRCIIKINPFFQVRFQKCTVLKWRQFQLAM